MLKQISSKSKFLNIKFSRSLFISTEETPNPNTLKFITGNKILLKSNGKDYRSLQSTRGSPLAREVISIHGVSGVFLGKDFIAVTKKEEDANLTWGQLKPFVFSTLMDFYSKEGAVAVTNEEEGDEEEKNKDKLEGAGKSEEELELVLMIKELLEEKVRPMAVTDGGDVIFKDFDHKNGVVTVQLVGSCVGCPSSTITLKNGVENMLKHYIPEVKRVDHVVGSSDQANGSSEEHHLKFEPNNV